MHSAPGLVIYNKVSLFEMEPMKAPQMLAHVDSAYDGIQRQPNIIHAWSAAASQWSHTTTLDGFAPAPSAQHWLCSLLWLKELLYASTNASPDEVE